MRGTRWAPPYPHPMRKINTRGSNVTSRRIGGSSRSHSVGTHTFQVMFVMRCADLLESSLGAGKSAKKKRLFGDLRCYHRVDSSTATDVRISLLRQGLLEGLELQNVGKHRTRTVCSCSRYTQHPAKCPAGEISGVLKGNL